MCVCVCVEVEEGWWSGIVNGKTGLFPSNFVKEIETSEDGESAEVADEPGTAPTFPPAGRVQTSLEKKAHVFSPEAGERVCLKSPAQTQRVIGVYRAPSAGGAVYQQEEKSVISLTLCNKFTYQCTAHTHTHTRHS